MRPFPTGLPPEPVSGNVVLINIALLSVGIETTDGVMTKLISHNTVVPTKKSQKYVFRRSISHVIFSSFSTATGNQQTVLIQIYKGEHSLTKDNNLLGKFELTGVPPLPVVSLKSNHLRD